MKNVSQADARPLRQVQGRAQAQARRVPRVRRCADRRGRRAYGGSFRRRPARRCRRHQHRQGLRRRHEAAQFRRAARRVTVCRSATAATARPATARTPARCSRARRWPAIWAMRGPRCRTWRCIPPMPMRGLILVAGAVPGAEGRLCAGFGREEAQAAGGRALPGRGQGRGSRGQLRRPSPSGTEGRRR